MGNEKDEGTKLRVVDRRRFDAEGNERDSSASEPTKSKGVAEASPSGSTSPSTASPEAVDSYQAVNSAQVVQATPVNSTAEASARMSDENPDISFSSFLVSLATQALMQLGEVAAPEGMSVPRDISAAKHTIDILGMLEKKTGGNLDKDEQQLLTEVLHSLRMCYVRHSKK